MFNNDSDETSMQLTKSHSFREDANEEVIDKTPSGKQGHLPLPTMVKVT